MNTFESQILRGICIFCKVWLLYSLNRVEECSNISRKVKGVSEKVMKRRDIIVVPYMLTQYINAPKKEDK